jgi:hypothetical protein
MDIISPQNDLKQPILCTVDGSKISEGSCAFHPNRYSSVSEAFHYGLNEQFWRWGLVFSQGNELNVSANRVKERSRYMASKLLRRIYGNRYRDKALIRFLVFQHGSSESFNEHYHALMGFCGKQHNWSDFRGLPSQIGRPRLG